MNSAIEEHLENDLAILLDKWQGDVELSNSKKEIRLLGRHTTGNQDLDLSDSTIQEAIINTLNSNSGDYLMDFVYILRLKFNFNY